MASKPPPSNTWAKDGSVPGRPNCEEEDMGKASKQITIRPTALRPHEAEAVAAGQQLAQQVAGQQHILDMMGPTGALFRNNRPADWGRPTSVAAPVNAPNSGDPATLVRDGESLVGNSIPVTFPPSATAASLPGLFNKRNPEGTTTANGSSMTLGSSFGIPRAYSSSAAQTTNTDRNALLQHLFLQQQRTQEAQVQTASTQKEIQLLSQIQGHVPPINLQAGGEDARPTHQFLSNPVPGQGQMLRQHLVAMMQAQSNLPCMASAHQQQHPEIRHPSSVAAGMPRIQSHPLPTTLPSSIAGAAPACIGAISDVVSSNAPATTVARLKSRLANREEAQPTSNAGLARSDLPNNSSICAAKRPATAMSHVGTNYAGQYKPKRALSAYNLFFKEERVRLLKQEEDQRLYPQPRRRSSFEEMGREIGRRWKQIDPERRIHFQRLAAEEKARYQQQLALYNERKLERIEAKFLQREATVTEAARKQYLESEGASLLRKRKKKSNKEGKVSGCSKDHSIEGKSK